VVVRPDGGQGPLDVALAAIRGLAAICGAALLYWAWMILDNIWTYNDSGTLTYVLLALVVAIPGCALVAFAFLAGRLRR
jgi:hypothetical protein